jgi:dTDP-4-dehydrorhamnose 3,5-epimerase
MQFKETSLEGAFVVESEAHLDSRGFFARLRCSREFALHGLPDAFVQTNLSYNKATGTFRGLHFQAPPSTECKLVRCLRGSMRDVIVDIRPGSATFLEHTWISLSADVLAAVFVPAGFAHGFITESDDTLVLYEMTDFFAPELARGMRWNDPALSITELPGLTTIHPRDAEYPDLDLRQLEVFR